MAIVGSFPPKEFIKKTTTTNKQTNLTFFAVHNQVEKATRLSYIMYTGRGNTTTLTHDPVINTISTRVDNYRTPTAANTHGAAQLFFLLEKKTNTATQTAIIRHPPTLNSNDVS